ncbi:Sin3 associated polypeptide p18-domain-containing protein [Cerioporus squamosus]|nr:Sin3 associated polypeptide p18-domain-containing protein [Cerioporus squamosus]
MEDSTPAGKPIVDREKTAPFLIRTFVKIGTYHRLNQFEDGPLPLADEQQIYTWRDATLREVLTTLRSSAPNSTEYRHPLARYSFRAVFADSASRGRFSQKDLGTVYSRDILGEPGTLDHPAPRLLEDAEAESTTNAEQDRTLDELRFVPGDYLCVMVQLPKGVTVPTGPGGELSIKGSAGPPANGWKAPGGVRGDAGWGGGVAANPGPGAGPGLGRGGGGHWRGNSGPEGPGPRGGRGGGRGDFGRDRDRDRDRDDRRVPPPRRDSPPRRDGGWGRRGASRSRSPPRRRGRYD